LPEQNFSQEKATGEKPKALLLPADKKQKTARGGRSCGHITVKNYQHAGLFSKYKIE